MCIRSDALSRVIRLRGGRAAIFFVLCEAIVFAWPHAGAASDMSAFELGKRTRSPDGILRIELRSSFQPGSVSLRILAPDSLAEAAPTIAAEQRCFLFVLPVERGEENRYGDGLQTIAALGVHKRFDWIVVAPTFAQLPWYCDHPTSAHVRQESHMIEAVVPAMDRLYPSRRPVRLLLGFSKSGWGAVSLMLRRPELFHAAAVWDAPLMVAAPNRYGMAPIFETQANFDRYYLPRRLQESADVLRGRKRLALFGYDNFRADMSEFHKRLVELHIPHDFADGPRQKHHWDGGWVARCIDSLVQMAADAAGVTDR
ncbi:MAG: hypothetical protein N3D11_17770 [Candidatus Sumerlaeia bacterium]|nr:hypothetical protein [Candidatus Sumerlaeia bacterium]